MVYQSASQNTSTFRNLQISKSLSMILRTHAPLEEEIEDPQ